MTTEASAVDEGIRVVAADRIRAAVGLEHLVDPVREAFKQYSQGLGEAPIVVFAPQGANGDVHVKSAWLPGRPIFTVKIATWFAARSGGPSSGYSAVHDAHTGDLLALLIDEHHLTDARTAAAGAVVTAALARDEASTVAVLGTGTQAYLQVLAAAQVRPVTQVQIWGRDRRASLTLREALRSRRPDLVVSISADAHAAVREADIVITATSSREPVLSGGWLRAGQHITAVGADDPTKTELDPACFARADVVVVDSRRAAPALAGDLRRAAADGVLPDICSLPEVGDLLLRRHPGRQTSGDITLGKLIGLGVQDLVAATVTLARLNDVPTPTQMPPASAQDLRRAAVRLSEAS